MTHTGWSPLLLLLLLLASSANAQTDGMAELASALNKNVEAIDRLAPSMNSLVHAWDTDMKPSVDDALKLVNATLDRFDETMAYAKGTLIPLVLGLATLWVVLCCVSIVMCVVLPSRTKKPKKDKTLPVRGGGWGSEEAPLGRGVSPLDFRPSSSTVPRLKYHSGDGY